MEGRHPLRGAGYYHQPVQAGEGPQGHRCGEGRPPAGLSEVPAVQGERGLRRAAGASRTAESAAHTRHPPKGAVVFPIQPLCLLQRALHRFERPARPHEDRQSHLPPAVGLHQAIPPLFCGQQRRSPHRGRLYSQPRPFPGRPPCFCHGKSPCGADHHLPGLRGRGGRHCQVAHVCDPASLQR